MKLIFHKNVWNKRVLLFLSILILILLSVAVPKNVLDPLISNAVKYVNSVHRNNNEMKKKWSGQSNNSDDDDVDGSQFFFIIIIAFSASMDDTANACGGVCVCVKHIQPNTNVRYIDWPRLIYITLGLYFINRLHSLRIEGIAKLDRAY